MKDLRFNDGYGSIKSDRNSHWYLFSNQGQKLNMKKGVDMFNSINPIWS